MINTTLDVDDICHGCPYFSAETNCLTSYDCMHMIYISCEHRNLCNRLRKYIEKEMSKND